jgi:hypothetical protein
MLAVLGFILDGIELIGSFIVFGVEAVLSAFFAALAGVWILVVAILPSMPQAPSLSGQWLGWLNWFYPVGDLLGGLAAMVAIWLTFLAVRFVLRFIRQV